MTDQQNETLAVSFIITAFKARFLREAIDSIYAQQDVEGFEILVMDDCADNSVADVVAGYDDARIRYIKSATQLGGLVGMDYGVRLSRGRYIKFLNDDDVLAENCVVRLRSALEQPGVILATSRRKLIDDSGNALQDRLFNLMPVREDARLLGKDVLEFFRVFPINFIGEPSTIMVRRRDLLGAYPHLSALNNRLITSVNDLAVYARLLMVGDLGYVQEHLSCFRIHAGQNQRHASAQTLGENGRKAFLAQLDAMLGGEIKPEGQVQAKPLWDQSSNFQKVDFKGFYQKAGGIDDAGLMSFSDLERRTEECGRPGGVISLDNWYGQRELSIPLAKRLETTAARQSLCLVLIDEKPEDYNLNISVLAFRIARYYCPSLSCLVLTPDESFYRKELFQDVSFAEYDRSDLISVLNEAAASDLKSDWVVVARTPSELTPAGLVLLLAELESSGAALDAAYGDELVENNGKTESGYFRPGLNLDMLLSSPADMSRHWLFRRATLVELGGFSKNDDSAFELGYILRLIEERGFGCIGRTDEPLFLLHAGTQTFDLAAYVPVIRSHLERRGYAGAGIEPGLTSSSLRVRYPHAGAPLVSIIIPTKDQLHLLQTCVESILEKTAYPNYEILVVDNNSETPEARTWLDGLNSMGLPNLRVLRYPKPFNFSAINNFAVTQSRGDYVLLLNNDTGIIKEDWLDALMNHAQRPEVGIVGAKLLFPNGKVQHAGVVVGMRGPAEHICIDAEANDPGYMNRLMVDQNYSAVTGACMLVRKSVYEQVGGLDEEAFAVSYNDIDFCLKVAQAGYLSVWTPHALVMHVANASQTSVDKTADENKVRRFQKEQEAMFQRWLPYMGNDPAFNRNLSLRANGFEVDHRVELNWQPQKALGLSTILAHPADPWGCGHYRIMQPLLAMKEEAVAGGMADFDWLNIAEMARLDPDVLVYQRQITDQAVEHMQSARRILKKPTVFELDDYLPNLPIKSAYRENMPKDILKSLRRSLKHVDRFVVSTYPLAEAFSGLHPDIQVVENRLPVAWWGDLESLRRQSEKPRVGWAGGMGHTGDLELVEAVVQELADEVEWVFFGMCPDKLRPFVAEVHEGIEISRYPRKLASLNLDLAIAPLEDNLFNRCKSNLRLLEYGACGYPVVCSDVEPYRAHGLPVTLVKNRFKDWVDAIRMHLSDMKATARAGDKLKQSVREKWMLSGDNLTLWLNAWTKF
ncbi:glycosyltransferase [Marinobacter nauticus]|uniref:glycosyltransferase n=1 Tax=Marinobacter nauticus TaxID=2743 RepID=UPI00242F9ADA|nr:glycosyltransferase [Marinobacter nauticus]